MDYMQIKIHKLSPLSRKIRDLKESQAKDYKLELLLSHFFVLFSVYVCSYFVLISVFFCLCFPYRFRFKFGSAFLIMAKPSLKPFEIQGSTSIISLMLFEHCGQC